MSPLALDLSRQPTTLINIEYDPWCLIFWQTLIARNRTNPAIKLVCTVKRAMLLVYFVIGAANQLFAQLNEISFRIKNAGQVFVAVYDDQERMLRELAHGMKLQPGQHHFSGTVLSGTASPRYRANTSGDTSHSRFHPRISRQCPDVLYVRS
jgi:hypothetical protein